MADFQTLNLAQIYGAADQANAQKQENMVRQYQIKKMQDADAEDTAVKSAFSGAVGPDGTLDRKILLGNLYKSGLGQKALEAQTTFNTQDIAAAKNKREDAAANLTNKTGTIKYLRDVLAGVTDQASYEHALGEAKSLGANVLTDGAPAQYNPDWVRGHIMDADTHITQSTPKYEKVDLGGKVQIVDTNPFTNPSIKGTQFDKTMTPGEIASNNIANQNVGIARGNLGVNQARLGIDQQKLALEQQNGGQKAPSGYRYLPNGDLQPIAGGPGDKTQNPTEVQGKAALFASRASEADKILNQLDGKYSPYGINTKMAAESTPVIGGVIGPLANKSLSDESQKAEQAQRDFVNAVLRLESGAAISEGEFSNAKKQYFPQPGDSAAVIKQKAQNRQTAIQGLSQVAGPLGKANANANASAPTMPKIGTTKNGYVFLGGDPSQQASWKKQ